MQVYIGKPVLMKIGSGLKGVQNEKIVEGIITDVSKGFVRVEYENEHGAQRVLLPKSLKKLDWPYAEYEVLKTEWE
jgi:hypothetical protein